MNEHTAKQNFSGMGMSIFLFLVITTILQIATSAVVTMICGENGMPDWAFWLCNFIPMYCIGFPICYLLLKRIPREDLRETTSLSVGGWLKFFVIGVFVMLVGNLIGLGVGQLFQLVGINTAMTVESLVSNTSVLSAIVMAVCAPIVEELLFRKLLIDRMHVYGGRVAVVTSALMFGLFHGNFSQFFYAFFLGLVWGYVYYKTGKVIYTILMHMITNFCGGVIAPMLVRGVDLTGDPLALVTSPSFFGLLLYEAVMFAVAIIGLVLFIRGRKKISYAQEAQELPKEEQKTTVWCNIGMILFLVSCIGLFVLSLVSGLIA
ncbi:MAG: CPBP family intramembrane metalloprotease [Lachnospiraceae bacterium]|nr:CPBP family intramembrane metalloprotease [Lachnospiraceae bacterium]